jgi:predicted nucleotidyltransferase
MEKNISKIIKYFMIFKYPPSFDELYAFFPIKTSKKALKTAILKSERQNKVKIIYKSTRALAQGQRYTVGEYTIVSLKRDLSMRKEISQVKLNNWRFRVYLKLISHLPQIKLVGLSGSISMDNAKDGDDIDLFIITSKNRLFTGRFLSLVLSQLFGLRRKFDEREAKNKVCLNLFFDESDLTVPRHKRSIFVGHEVLQMKPLVNKNNIYDRFIEANSWVFKLFPNSKKPLRTFPRLRSNTTRMGDLMEGVLKYMEIKLINSHKTTELITDTQLWFHPDDFEKKINGKI